MIKDLFMKYKSIIMYALFGVLTTVVNMGAYFVSYNVLRIPNVPSTVIAWILAVAFAFITNKLWVFDSPSFDAETLKHEIPTFFGARLATGILDVVIMFLAVDLAHSNPSFWKLVSNVLVILINYIASKLVIFNKNKK